MMFCCTLVERQEEGVSGRYLSSLLCLYTQTLPLSSAPLCFLFPLSLQNVHLWEYSASFPWLWLLPLIRRGELPRPHQPLGDWPFSCSELFDTAGYRASSVFFRADQHVDLIITSTETILYINTESEMTEPLQMLLESDLIPKTKFIPDFFLLFLNSSQKLKWWFF